MLSVAATAIIGGCSNPSGTPTDSPGGGDTTTPLTADTKFTPGEDWQAPADMPTGDVSWNVLVENLEIPWGLSWGSNGDLFLTERVGQVSRFTSGELDEVLAPDDTIDAGAVPPGHDKRPWWVMGGEGGTLGVAVHPDYPNAQALFVYYTVSGGDNRVNRVSRFDISANDPAGTETVLVGDIPASNNHNGGRITFGPRGYLWVTTGDSGEGKRAGDLGSLGGKVLRITAEGDPAPGNPDIGEGADPRVYTYGHRNPQGIIWLPDDTIVVSEHGQSGHDELNRLESGANYRWPDTRKANEYASADNVHPPLANSGNNTWAPTGSVFYTGDVVPSWRNRILVGGLVSQQLLVITLTPPDGELPPAEGGAHHYSEWYDEAYIATVHPILQDKLGRIRHVEQGPEGALYAITSNRDGRAKQPFPRESDDVLVRLEIAG